MAYEQRFGDPRPCRLMPIDGDFLPRKAPDFHGGNRSGSEKSTSLTLVQRNRRFGDRSGDREATFAVFGTAMPPLARRRGPARPARRGAARPGRVR